MIDQRTDRTDEVSLEASTAWLHLFGDATRLRLLALLEEHELSVADLVAITDLPQSRVSTHLGKLREASVLHDRRVGSSTLYRASASMPSAARALWGMLRASLSDATLRTDAERREARLRAQEKAAWPDTVAGEMERHWSPGRTWESLVHGVSSLLTLGDVLDVGCGDGWSARLLAPRSRSYVGLDRSEKVLGAARRRTKGLGNARFELGEMERLPFADASFDQVLLFHVLVHAEVPSVALTEAARVLRPGGSLAVVTLAAHGHADLTAPYGHRHAGFTPEALRSMLRAAGLRVAACDVTSRERKAPHYEVLTASAVNEHAPSERDSTRRTSERRVSTSERSEGPSSKRPKGRR
ncbi:MAG: metalloregulator ArsR/SmtB family transcription factor [Sandaracinus sp.]|nr:metalloregulator ArsR/SmtB family transcription factor [Sandaracinus sp.]